MLVGFKYKCHLCDYVARKKPTLATHMIRHTGVKPYICQECGKGYNTANSLKQHSKIHTGEKLACDYKHTLRRTVINMKYY